MSRKYYDSRGPIIQVIGEFVPAGAEFFVRNLSIALAQAGKRVEVWQFYKAEDVHPGDDAAIAVETDFKKSLEKHGVTVRQIGKRPNSDFLPTWRKLRKLARRVRPSIVHAHLEEISFHVAIGLTATGIPLVQTMHNEHIRRTTLLKTLFRWCFDRFICISDEVSSATAKYIPERQLAKVPNGIPLDGFLYPERNYNRPVEQLIAVGRLSAQKNHAMMIQAYNEFRNSIDNPPKLTIYGEGELRESLEQQIRNLALDDFVSLPGTTLAIDKKLKSSDLYLMSSNHEGMSISLLEAMATGLPIVITDVSGASDLLENGENALISPIGNANTFGENIQRLYLDQALRQTVGNGAIATAKSYGIDLCAERHITVYEELKK